MDNTINGRTPEEIKKGLECCSPRYESQHWVTCSSECPFRNEGVYCRNVLHACNKKYIQLLEDGIDRVYKQVDALRGLPEKIQQLERERYAAVKDMTELMQLGMFCSYCKHLADDGECTKDYNGIDTKNLGKPGGWWCWQWRGVQEVE